MSNRDRYRMVVAMVLLILGVIILVRVLINLQAWPIGIFGAILVAFGVYRLNQARVYFQSVRR